jgi:hypothetical protein
MSIILRALGIVGVTALVGAAAAAINLPASEIQIGTGARHKTTQGTYAPLPAVNAAAPSLILEMSPFALDRSAFDRATASAPPTPPVEVKLTGVFQVGKELQASLVINGHSIVVRRGVETAAGTVVKIEPGAVTISGASEQRLEIFK